MAEPGTRVVFVSVRGRDAALPRTRRKRALGVSSDATLDSFHSLVCTRLALRAVKAIYHADGRVLRSMEELQDIEDLEVEEVEDPGGEAKGHGAPYSSPPSVQTSRKAGQGGLSIAVDAEGDGDEDKYARRVSLPTRLMQQLLPSWAAPGGSEAVRATPSRTPRGEESLGEPVGATARRRKARRQAMRRLSDPSFMLMVIALFSCVGTLFLLFSKRGKPSSDSA